MFVASREVGAVRRTHWVRFVFTALFFFTLRLSAAEHALQIRAEADPTRVTVVAQIPEALRARIPNGRLTQERGESWLRLFIVTSGAATEAEAMLGNYERREATLQFAPRYALVPGQRYRAVAEWGRGETASAEYRVPERAATASTRVVAIYPSAAELPANQLKFYLHFSQPMRQTRGIFEHLDLLGPNGRAVEDPWRRTELWNEDGTRLTLLIHPGRIKQGLVLGALLGPVLEPEQPYTLIVHGTLLDATGRPLAAAFTKKFRTRAAERTVPQRKDWRVSAPRVATSEPVALTFSRSMDRALLERLVSVKDDLGETVGGRVEIRSDETVWMLHPHRPWRDRNYIVVVDSRLEDLAGNSPARLFDAAVSDAETSTAPLEILFRPAAPQAQTP